MIYPISILVVMVIVIFIMMVFVIPNFADMFAGIGTDLPVMTKMVMDMSNFFVKWWYLIIGLMILAIVGLRFLQRHLWQGHLWWNSPKATHIWRFDCKISCI